MARVVFSYLVLHANKMPLVLTIGVARRNPGGHEPPQMFSIQ